MKKDAGVNLALGTVQFGLNYGVSNVSGKVSEPEVVKIINEALRLKISTLDTAIVYGDSESVLGRIGVNDFDIVTKLPELPKNVTNLDAWVIDNVQESLKKLNVKKIYALLLHRSYDFMGEYGFKLYDILCKLRKDGVVSKLGVSIYSPIELDRLEDSGIKIDILQTPFNVLDRRIETSGWLRKLKLSGVEIHARSVFLQGLLLQESKQRNQYFSKWKDHLDNFDEWVKKSNQTPLEACLNFVSSNSDVDKIVVGVENRDQLMEIVLSIENTSTLRVSDYLQTGDIQLIDPSNWKYFP
jgi:aryl-alcohol dehydrogenase-like predicted oxidoreductase